VTLTRRAKGAPPSPKGRGCLPHHRHIRRHESAIFCAVIQRL